MLAEASSLTAPGAVLAAGFTFLDRQVGQRAFSRKLEVEADTLGLELMARAGFDPRAAVELWQILNEASGPSLVV